MISYLNNAIKTVFYERKKTVASKHYKKVIQAEAKKIPQKRLSSDQQKRIKEYYLELTGYKVNLLWHQYYYSRNGIFSTKYIPLDLYYSDILYRLNNFSMRKAYSDKNVYDIFFSDFKLPPTILKRINGYFYSDYKSININEAIDKCNDVSKAIIKPSLEGTWGSNVRLLSVSKGKTNINDMTIEEIFNFYGENFIIQGFVEQHKSLEKLNHSSVNTIRVITFRNNTGVHSVYTVLRIGGENSYTDNIGGGGIGVKIHNNGKLNNVGYGLSATDVYTTSGSGVVLDNYLVPSYASVVDAANEMLKRLDGK